MKSQLRFIFSLLFLYVFIASAMYSSDTVRTRIVAPGVIHTEYARPGPFTLDVLEVELANPFIRLETFRSNGLVRTSLQARANDREGHRVIGAVNADFFSFETGWPIGNQVARGTFVLGTTSNRSHILVGGNNKPFIERIRFSGRVWATDNSSATIAGSNIARTSSNIVFYTSYYGTGTKTDNTGAEVAVEFISEPAALDTLLAIVKVKSNDGNMTIPAAGGVISFGSGLLSTANKFSVGDTLRLFLGFNVNVGRITDALGGGGRILVNGRAVFDSVAALEGIGSDFLTARHPRTFLAFNKDTTKFYLCTVDGRQATSVGMNFAEMANFLLSIGAWNAVNLDGGGSTTMVVRDEVVNSPSDPGGERSVANSFHVVSVAPTGSLNRLEIFPRRSEVFQGGTVQFTLAGFDQYHNPLTLPTDIIWSVDPRLGSLSSTGRFTAQSANDSGWVKAEWNTVRDSVFIVIRALSFLRVYPNPLVMVPGERLTLNVRAMDTELRTVTLNNTQATYASSNSSLNADGAGVITAMGFGSGEVTVRLDTLRFTVPFNTNGTDTAVVAEPFNDLFAWHIQRINADPAQLAVSIVNPGFAPAPPSLLARYSLPATPRPSLVLSASLPISGRPDSLFVRVYGTGNGDSLRLFFTDKDGQNFSITSLNAVTWSGTWGTVAFRLNRAVALSGGNVDFPITVTQLRLDFGSAAASGGIIAGDLYLDELSVHYPNRTVAPQVLWDFESGITGWLTPAQSNAAQLKGINIAASSLVASAEVAYQGTFSGKWTFVDDPNNAADWDVRMTRSQNADLGLMLRGSYIGAWMYATGRTDCRLHTVVRDGNGTICSGPAMPVNHLGWKLIGTKLEESLFTPYLTAGRITDANNKFNGFRFQGPNSALHNQTRVIYIDKLVTSALTVPTGFIAYSASWNAPLVRLHWVVNSEISISRYGIERSEGGNYMEVGVIQAVGNTDTTQHYEFVDTPPTGSLYSYRVRQYTNDGGQELTAVIQVNTTTGDIGPDAGRLRDFELGQNYPNPFNPSTTIRFYLPIRSDVRLSIYDVLGKKVSDTLDGQLEAGEHTVEWIPAVSSGVYFYALEATGVSGAGTKYSSVRKMLFVK